MTRKLEELFDMPNADTEETNDSKEDTTESFDIVELNTAMKAVDKVDAALPLIRDIESSDIELDEIADLAKDTFTDLMDLGMNVEARHAGEIFNNASKMLDTALSAKTSKINKKLKMIDLQVKKATLDARIAKDKRDNSDQGDSIEDGTGVIMDRNALLDHILGKTEK